MEPMSPIDHGVSLFQTERSPMNIGGLLLLEVPESAKPDFARRMLAHMEGRIPRSVLGRRLVAAPAFYDADSWFRISGESTMERVFIPSFEKALSYPELLAFVTGRSMIKLELDDAAFEMYILDKVEGPRCAIYLKVHHSIMDGVGFQSLVELLSDQGGTLPAVDTDADEPVPSDEAWTELARQKFEREAPKRAAFEQASAKAAAELGEFNARPGYQRATAPEMVFGAEITTERDYRTVSFPLEAVRAIGKGLGATINDVFLAISAGALRGYLAARDELPAEPLVSHCVRSSRRAEHGLFGNRVVSIYPELATDEADRVVRLRRIRDSMIVEKQRSMIEEVLQDLPETPYGARDRRIALSDPAMFFAALGSANVVLSNVPGPAEPLSFAGFRLTGNHPVPIIGPRRFFNITSRRNADRLDMGVMVDAAKVHDIDDFVARLHEEFEALKVAAGTA